MANSRANGPGKAEQRSVQLEGRISLRKLGGGEERGGRRAGAGGVGGGTSEGHSWKTLKSHRMQGDSSGRTQSSPMIQPSQSLYLMLTRSITTHIPKQSLS